MTEVTHHRHLGVGEVYVAKCDYAALQGILFTEVRYGDLVVAGRDDEIPDLIVLTFQSELARDLVYDALVAMRSFA